jgi:outer membrane protein TolC
MKTKNYLLVTLFSVIFSSVWAQSPMLEVYIQEGLKSNLLLQQEQMNYERSVQNLQIAQALFLPTLSANASYTLANGGRKIEFPVGDLLNPVYSTLNSITGTSNFPQIANVSQQFLPNNFHDTKFRVIQPLFNPEIYFNYKAQKELISVQDAQKRAYENELKYSIASAYYQYLESEESLLIYEKTRELLTELLKINHKLVANDKATQDVVLNAAYELDKVEFQLAQARKNNHVAKSYFNFLLNRDLSSAIDKDSTIRASLTEQSGIAELTETALNQRQEIKQLQGVLQTSKQVIGLSKGNAYLPKINVVGDIGYQGFKYKFDYPQQYWLVQFSLSWDLFKGGEKKVKMQQAKLDYQVTENKMAQLRKQIELQVIQNYYDLEATEQSYLATQGGIRNAEKSFQIIRTKYFEGQALLIEYLDAQNKLTTSRLAETIGAYEVLRSEAALRKTIANL